jgi:hypothetical protein
VPTESAAHRYSRFAACRGPGEYPGRCLVRSPPGRKQWRSVADPAPTGAFPGCAPVSCGTTLLGGPTCTAVRPPSTSKTGVQCGHQARTSGPARLRRGSREGVLRDAGLAAGCRLRRRQGVPGGPLDSAGVALLGHLRFRSRVGRSGLSGRPASRRHGRTRPDCTAGCMVRRLATSSTSRGRGSPAPTPTTRHSWSARPDVGTANRARNQVPRRAAACAS